MVDKRLGVVQLEISDGCETVSYEFAATATNDEPEFVSSAPITLDLGNEYLYAVVVEDEDVCPNGCQELTFDLIEGPAGMSILKIANCEAELSWNPECADLIWEQVCTGGDCSNQYKSVVHVKIAVDDDCCDPVYKEFDITVYTNNHAPQICDVDLETDCSTGYIFKKYYVVEGKYAHFIFRANDNDGDELIWEIVDHNLAGSLTWSDNEGKEATLHWDEASCDPVIEKGTSRCIECEEICERFIIVKVTDEGCPELSDEYCIDFHVWNCCPD